MATETKHQKFKRLCQDRTDKALDKIRLLGNLSNTAQYDFTKSDVNKMLSKLREALDDLEAKFGI